MAIVLSGEPNVSNPVNCRFKRIQAGDQRFGTLDHMVKSRGRFAISEIAKQLSLNQSTAFNIIHALMDLRVLRS